MVFAAHFSGAFGVTTDNTALYWVLVLIMWIVVELFALGVIGGLDNGFNKAVFDDHRRTIIYAFVYWAIIYFVGWELIMQP